MKKLLILTALFAAGIVCADLVVPTYLSPIIQQPIDTGRYTISTGTVPVVTAAGPIQTPFIFKLDTATGRTWMFTFISQPGQTNVGWIPLPDLNVSYLETNPIHSPPTTKPQ